MSAHSVREHVKQSQACTYSIVNLFSGNNKGRNMDIWREILDYYLSIG